MKKVIVTIFITVLISCTTVNKNIDKFEIYSSFAKTKSEFMEIIEQNNKKKIDKFFIKGLRNRIVLKELKKYDFNNYLIILSDSIEIINADKIKTLFMINNGIDTLYFDVTWKRYNNIWKISSFYEKY